jgi:hypothetical protein
MSEYKFAVIQVPAPHFRNAVVNRFETIGSHLHKSLSFLPCTPALCSLKKIGLSKSVRLSLMCPLFMTESCISSFGFSPLL